MAIEDENNYGLSGAQVKELTAQIKKRAVSVGEDGSSHVEEADQIYTKTLQLQEAGFIFRTTAGNLSVETGSADLLAIKGHTIQEGHRDEVKNESHQFADAGATVTVDWTKLINFIHNFSTYHGAATFWMTWRDAGDGMTNWGLQSSIRVSGGNNTATLRSTWGIDFQGTETLGDTITIEVSEFAIGTLTTATPTSFVATGYNQYDATAGYARVIGGNQYRIAGTYTSIGIADEPGGTTTTLEVTDGKFTPEADGYVYVSGASGDILIALVWSGTRDSDPYEAFSKTTITIPTIDKESNSLPTATYGMPSVGDVADELNFADRLYIQRIGHYAYSAENLETVEALGVDYWYDEEDIFYVLETPIEYKLADSVRGEYTANDFGTEEFVGTSVSVGAMLTYGNNLVDKLRNLLDIQSIGDKLELNGSELNVAQSALSDIKGFTILTAADYDYKSSASASKPDAICGWNLKDGWYVVNTGGYDLQTDTNSSAQDIKIFAKATYNGVIYYVYFDPGSHRWKYWSANATTHGRAGYGSITPEIIDGLTSTSTSSALSAKQGKVLKDLIDDLDARVTALEGN